MVRHLIFTLFAILAVNSATSQVNVPFDRILNLQVESALNLDNQKGHTAIKPYRFQDINSKSIGGILEIDSDKTSRLWIFRKAFYENFIEQSYDSNSSKIIINPLVDFQYGYDTKIKRKTWQNSKGINLQGYLNKSISFESTIWENQALMPSFSDSITRAIGVISGQARYKNFKTNGFDYFFGTGVVDIKATKRLSFQFGHDKNFIGDGYRSLLLSDNAANYPFLKVNAVIGPVRYMILYMMGSDPGSPKISNELGFRKKYSTMHYLDWAVSKKFNVGFFEAVVWPDADSSGKRGFDLNYLNPVMLLRPQEYQVGAKDNVLIGFNFKYKPVKGLAIYSQLIVDEFKLDHLRKQDGWWANKYGGQLGAKLFEPFKIKNFVVQAEINAVRPFTYSHYTRLTSYTHFNQPLAHPLGANFSEFLLFLNYRYQRAYVETRFSTATYGANISSLNFGNDILKPNSTRISDLDNFLYQGAKTNLNYIWFKLGYIVNPKTNLRVELEVVNRTQQVSNNTFSTNWINFSLKSAIRTIYTDY